MASFFFDADIQDDGVRFSLKKRGWIKIKRAVPPVDWVANVTNSLVPGAARLHRLLEEHVDDDPPTVLQDDESVFVSHPLVASLEEHIARSLGLPPSTLLILGIDCRGAISDPNFSISARWLTGGTIQALGVSTRGSILYQGGNVWRIPEPLYSIWEKTRAFGSLDTSDDKTRFRLISEIVDQLPSEERDKINAGNYLTRIRIAHAVSFSLRLRTDVTGFQFDPVLFGRKVQDNWRASDGEAQVSERESLLPEAMQELFAHQRFPRWQDCRDRYALRDGYYVYIEEPLQQALTVVRKAQNADHKIRRSFARSPQAFLKEALGETMDESVVESLFIPTEQYSERVKDLGIWQPPVLPWLKRDSTSWLPERFGILVGGKRVELSPEDVSTLRDLVIHAMDNGAPFVEFGGDHIPATSETTDALEQLLADTVPRTTDAPLNEEPEAPEASSRGQAFLIVDENYEDLAFRRQCKLRAPFNPFLPHALKTRLKQHQEDGLAWMQSAWSKGMPGVLLADDMGLGKTLLAMTFLCWVRETQVSQGMDHCPILVVAPTGLLKNWEGEHERHLEHPGLGEVVRAYGRDLNGVRLSGLHKGRDTDLGEPQLNTLRLQEADWILTTYETLRDYHLSFASVPVAVAVYDEMQKVKNPTSQLSGAAKTINADFTLGLTGTPIENRLEDLWAIMDVIYPGFLGDLKGFSKKFKEENIDALKDLKKRLMEPVDDQPAVMLRRMKFEHLPGLPEKKVEALRETMPEKQALAYSQVLARTAGASGNSILPTLHCLRSISLHPVDPRQWQELGDEYVAWSARLSCTFRILDSIAVHREKALVFLESLDMQEVLAVMLQRRYRLDRLPLLINGSVTGPKRQDAVDTFQSQSGRFDVMILSPKAGGVGLTLTAANHVIHLSRWWNPAVEDQCTDRIYRIGQDRDVHVYYPLAVHPDPTTSGCSFDLKLHELLERKRAMCRDVLIPPESASDADALYKGILGERAV